MLEIFIHNITSYKKKEKISQNFVNNSAQPLLSSMNKCIASFKKSSLWLIYDYCLKGLHANTQLCTTVMRESSRKKIS